MIPIMQVRITAPAPPAGPNTLINSITGPFQGANTYR